MEDKERVTVYQENNNYHWYLNNFNEGYQQMKNKEVLKYYKNENNENNKQELNNKISKLDEQIIQLIKQKASEIEQISFLNKAEAIKNKNKKISEYITSLKKQNKLNNWYTIDDGWRTTNIIENGSYILTLWFNNEPDTSWRTDKVTYEIGYTFKINDILDGKIIKNVSKKANTKEEGIKYLEGRKKTYENYFKEEKPAIIDDYSNCINQDGIRLDGYKLESEI